MRIIILVLFLIGIFMEKSNAESMPQPNSSPMRSIDGGTMKALMVACDQFLTTGADIRDFDVSISYETEETTNDDIVIITFMGKLFPGKRGLGTANRVPGSITYFVSRQKWKIVKEQGVK